MGNAKNMKSSAREIHIEQCENMKSYEREIHME